jgi:hypothetical protein
VIGGTVVPNYNFVLEIDLLVERAFNCLGNILLIVVSNDENANLKSLNPFSSSSKTGRRCYETVVPLAL